MLRDHFLCLLWRTVSSTQHHGQDETGSSARSAQSVTSDLICSQPRSACFHEDLDILTDRTFRSCFKSENHRKSVHLWRTVLFCHIHGDSWLCVFLPLVLSDPGLWINRLVPVRSLALGSTSSRLPLRPEAGETWDHPNTEWRVRPRVFMGWICGCSEVGSLRRSRCALVSCVKSAANA